MSQIIRHDFNGHSVSFDMDGWIDATGAAKRFGRRPNDWLSLPGTQSYMGALIKALTVDTGNSGIKLVRTSKVRGRAGTWLHPKLGVAFARWLCDDFAVWCDLKIDSIIRSGIVAHGNEQVLALVLRSEPADWKLRFHPSYYKALAKMTRTKYEGHAGGTPALFGQITDRWVYGAILPRDVHDELKARKDKSEKMHQWLTEGGQRRLDQHVTLVTLLAQSSTDQRDFEARCMQSFGMPGQMRLVFPVAA